MKMIACATLIEDLVNYPRNRVDETHVRDLKRALEAGLTLPPIVVEHKTWRIVDGVHRKRAYELHLGDAGKVPCDLRRYANDAEFYSDAVRLNAAHGRKLDRHDQTRIVLRMHELAVPDRLIGMLLHVPEEHVRTLELRVVHDEQGTAYPLKRGMEHRRGERLTPIQLQTVASVRSAEAGRLALELTRLLEADCVDLDNVVIVERLTGLRDAIDAALTRVAAAREAGLGLGRGLERLGR